VEEDDVEKEEDDENVEEPASLASIKTTHLTWGLGVRGGLGDKETGCRYQSVHKQPFRGLRRHKQDKLTSTSEAVSEC